MGQKVNPHGLRLGINKEWDSVWYAERDYAKLLHEDYKLRTHLKTKLYKAQVSKIRIQRTTDRVKITIHTASPGIIIGRSGQAILDLTSELQKLIGVGADERKVDVNIVEIKRKELDAQLVAEDIALQLENRVTFRRAMRQAMGRTMKMGARGIKTAVSGRLGGAEIARTESYHEGSIPLQTLRADIDYGFAEAQTTYGKLGVKVWLYKGDNILPQREDRPRRDNREGGRNHANAQKGKTSQAVPRQNDRQSTQR